MIGRLKELLSKEEIMYTEHTFSTDIGLTDLRDEPFSVSCETHAKQSLEIIILLNTRIQVREFISLQLSKTMQEHCCVRYCIIDIINK